MLERVRSALPQAQITGVHVQAMTGGGQDVIIGALQDQQFGPLVMFGSGGVEVEGLRDIAFALAPMTEEEAETLLESIWAGRKLKGYRNLPPADRASVLEVLFRVAQLAADFPQIAEIEINPLRVLSAGQGAIALDARARLNL
jgi:acetyltransferase